VTNVCSGWWEICRSGIRRESGMKEKLRWIFVSRPPISIWVDIASKRENIAEKWRKKFCVPWNC